MHSWLGCVAFNTFTQQVTRCHLFFPFPFPYPFLFVFRKILLATALLLPALGLRAQFGMGKPEDVKLVRKLPLIVVMQVEDPAIVRKLTKKPDELAGYRAALASKNEILKSQFQKYWKFSPEIQFRRSSEMDSLLKKPTQVYSTVRIADYVVSHHHQGSAVSRPSGGMNPVTGSQNTTTSYPNAYTETSARCGVRLQLLGKGRSNNGSVCLQQIEKGRVYDSDISFSVRGMQKYLENRAKGKEAMNLKDEVKANGPKLKTKTLLLDEEDVRESLTTADIKASYPYPIKLVERAVIEEAVLSEDPKYACVRLMPMGDKFSAQMVMSTDTGDVLAYSIPGYGTMMVANSVGASAGVVVKKSNLKDFAEFASGK